MARQFKNPEQSELKSAFDAALSGRTPKAIIEATLEAAERFVPDANTDWSVIKGEFATALAIVASPPRTNDGKLDGGEFDKLADSIMSKIDDNLDTIAGTNLPNAKTAVGYIKRNVRKLAEKYANPK